MSTYDWCMESRYWDLLEISNHNYFYICLLIYKLKADEVIDWTCAVRDCPSQVTTREGILVRNNGHHTHEGNQLDVASDRTTREGILVRNNGHHTPEGNQLDVASDRVIQKIRKRWREENTPVPTIYKEEITPLRTCDCIYKEEITPLRTRDWNVVGLPTYEGCRNFLFWVNVNMKMRNLC